MLAQGLLDDEKCSGTVAIPAACVTGAWRLERLGEDFPGEVGRAAALEQVDGLVQVDREALG